MAYSRHDCPVTCPEYYPRAFHWSSWYLWISQDPVSIIPITIVQANDAGSWYPRDAKGYSAHPSAFAFQCRGWARPMH